MAKGGGARKKTKWVSLSLASATTPTPPVKSHADSPSKSTRGTKAYTEVVSEANRDYRLAIKSTDRRLSSGTNRSRKQLTEQSISNDPISHKSYTAKGYHVSYSSSSASGRKSHFTSHNGTGSYRYSTNDHQAADARNEQQYAVPINEDEYTKITTPRQDVLFKKGYLTRPKMRTTINKSTSTTTNRAMMTSENENITALAAGTGSGSVSTAESVTSDSTYLTDAHFLDCPPPYSPYYGYFDPSGVLVMNGFAVDNNGFSYMNGGQTYIYPSNYNCQATTSENSPVEEDVPPKNPEDSVVACNEEIADSMQKDCEDVRAETSFTTPEAAPPPEQETNGTSCKQLSEEIAADNVEGVQSQPSLDQHVPQQEQVLSPYPEGYDYTQFYNAFYYPPGCVIAPFPILANGGMYYDPYQEEATRQLGFRKRKKRYRNWEEYPGEVHTDGVTEFVYPYPNYVYPDMGLVVPSETPTDSVLSEHAFEPQQMAPCSPATCPWPDTMPQSGNVNDSSFPSSQTEEVPSSASDQTVVKQKSKILSHPNQESRTPAKGKPSSQKARKKELIEATRAFAEQTIDLTRPICVKSSSAVRHDGWITVRNGKEVALEEEKGQEFTDTKEIKNMDTVQPISENPTVETESQHDSVAIEPVNTITITEIKHGKKELLSKKGKKTAKGKARKQKKINFAYQQKGFELIEPEFSPQVEKAIEQDEQDIEDLDEEPPICSLKADDEYIENVIGNECTQDLSEVFTTLAVTASFNSNDGLFEAEMHKSELLPRDVQKGEVGTTYNETIDSHVDDLNSEPSSCVCDSSQSVEQVVLCSTISNTDVPSSLFKKEVNDQLLCNELEVNSDKNETDTAIGHSPNVITPTDGSTLDGKTVPCTEIEEVDGNRNRHFSEKEYTESVDSGLQSPAAYVSMCNGERKSSSSSYNSSERHVSDAVTKWLSETLGSKRLEELFILPEDPILLHQIQQLNFLNSDDSFPLSSDTYSSSGDEVEDADSDYMSDVQMRKREIGIYNQKTDPHKDQLAKQTANGHAQSRADHFNHKQKRCIIM